jgi:hypothetical protein
MILSDIFNGAHGYVYWFMKTSQEVSEDDAQKIRQKAMSDMLYGAIQTAAYSGANQSMDAQTAMQRGWNEANKQIEQLEDGTEMHKEMFLVGDPNTIRRIHEIEAHSDFRGWSNSYIMDQIKNLE